MSIARILTNFMNTVRSDLFVKYEKDFANKISAALSEGYLQKAHEPKLVSIIETVVNNIHGLKTEDSISYFKVLTKAIFIHGNKSHVLFDYYGKEARIEFGDLIFIISIIFKGQKYFEKITINQFKIDRNNNSRISWDISNKEQLYLLSRFPTFTGVSGSLIPLREYTLPNYSGCLGSYGLLYKPGDFAFVSATELDSYIGDKNSMKFNELYNMRLERSQQPFIYPQLFLPDIEEFYYLLDRYYHHFREKMPFNLFNNYHHAYNTFDFAHKYLTMGIGEPIFMEVGSDNMQCKKFLYELMLAIKRRAQREGGEAGQRLSCFTNEFCEHSYTGHTDNGGTEDNRENIANDFDGEGIGIIYTTINLGE